MHKGHLVFAQLCEHLPKSIFRQCVARHAGRYPTLSFSHWDQLLCMLFAQLTGRRSLRDIVTALHAHKRKLYHAGFRGHIARSTLADANDKRSSQIYEDFALHLIAQARALYAGDALDVELAQTVYAVDSTTIDLCLSLFEWTPSTKGHAGVKVHTLLDLRGNIPAFIRVTPSRISDVSFLDELPLQAGSFYVMDRGYVHFARLIRLTQAGAFFVIRARNRMSYRVVEEHAPWALMGILRDESIVLTGTDSHVTYPLVLRRVEVLDAKHNRCMTLLCNHFDLPAVQVAALYKSRWQVELFFKWVKQNLKITAFIGTSMNAVKTQVWSALCAYVLVAIVRKRLQSSASMHTTLQALSVTLFETTELSELLQPLPLDFSPEESQLSLFDEISGQ